MTIIMIVFDIETIPQDEATLLANAPTFYPASNLKDPAKITASIAAKRENYIQSAALNWKTAEVAMIGYLFDGELTCFVDEEKTLLNQWLTFMADQLSEGISFVGHNIKGFDLPMIINRARVHRLPIPSAILSYWKGKSSASRRNPSAMPKRAK